METGGFGIENQTQSMYVMRKVVIERVQRARFEKVTQVFIQQKRLTFIEFLTDVCAILGGLVTIGGIMDGILHRLRTSKVENVAYR